MSRTNRTHDTAGDRDADRSRDPDRHGIITWVFIVSTVVGLWVLAPMITTFVSLTMGDTITLTLSRPDELAGPPGTELLGLTTRVPVDQLGSAARTGVIAGTTLELVAVLTMLIAVTVVMRSLRPGRELGNGTKVGAIITVLIAGAIGLIGANILTGAGVSACMDLYSTCSAGRTWTDPLTKAFPLAGIGLGLVFALVRSETVARRSTEGLV